MARLKHGAFLKKGAENPKAQGCASGEASQDEAAASMARLKNHRPKAVSAQGCALTETAYDAAKMLKVSRRNL